jgi:hypothetical protein
VPHTGLLLGFIFNCEEGVPCLSETSVDFQRTIKNYVRFEVFAAVAMKNGVFWNVTPCGSCNNLHFGGDAVKISNLTYIVFLYVKATQRKNEGGAAFIRNVGSYKSHKA